MGKNKPPQSKSQDAKKTAPGLSGGGSATKPTASAVPPQGPGAPSGSGAPAAGGAGIFNHPAPEGHAKTMSAVLGEIVWLMSQSPLHKQFFISDLEWFVMTPVMLQQFRIYYAADRPIGVVFWGFVSEEVEERLKQGVTKLRPHDWKSGDRLWIVEVINPFGGGEEMIKDLKEKVFGGREVAFSNPFSLGGLEPR